MTLTFFAVAAVTVGVAVLFTVFPLLRNAQPERDRLQNELDALDEQIDDLDPADYAERRKALRLALKQPQTRDVGFGLIAALVLAVPLATALLYTKVGEPEGLTPDQAPVAELRAELIRIANRLERDPDDFDQWARLGMAYKAIEEFSSAAHALRRALYIDEQNTFIMVELAETLMFASQSTRIPAESISLLTRAVDIEPQNQKALWLLGISAFQESDYEQALSWWQVLDSQLSPGSVRDSVREQIRQTRSRLGNDQAAGSEPPPNLRHGTASAEPSAAAFLVELALDPSFEADLGGQESVFLIARAAEGPSAPLAVQRIQVRDLPTTLALSDSDAMVDGLNLSSFTDITLTARVSVGGTAEPQPGDLEGRAGPINILETPSIQILIGERLER